MSNHRERRRMNGDNRVPWVEYDSSGFNEDEVLSRFKLAPNDIGDKVISLSEDVLLTCDSWSNPKSVVEKLEKAMNDARKRHLVFYDLWHDNTIRDILFLFGKYRHRCWSSIEFRGCQERHISAVLECALKMDIVQTVAFSLTSARSNPISVSSNSTFDIISRSMKNNQRFECLIFHSRPIHLIRYESLKKLPIKCLHFLDGTIFHPDEIPQLAEGLRSNHSLISFSFLGNIQGSNRKNVSYIVDALKSHPSLKRLVLCLKSAAIDGLYDLPSLLRCQNSKLESLTLSGGFTQTVFIPPTTFSEGLKGSNLKHLHLKDILLFPSDVEDVALGLKNNQSIESLSIELGTSNKSIVTCNKSVDLSPIAFAVQRNQTIQRLGLAGMYTLGLGICGIAELLSFEKSKLKNLHLPGVFFEKDSRSNGFLQVFLDGLSQNQCLESLDLSHNTLSNDEVRKIYDVVSTCRSLEHLDLGMNDITSKVLGYFAKHETPNKLAVLRVSSQNFSFFDMNDKTCQQLIRLLTTNPRLGDVNFNVGSVEWHQSYLANGKMKWHRKLTSFGRSTVYE